MRERLKYLSFLLQISGFESSQKVVTKLFKKANKHHGHRRYRDREEEAGRRVVEEPICAGGNCRDFGRECRARYARKRSLSLVSSLFLAAMLIRLSLENQQPFPRSLSLSNALSLSSFVTNKQVACSASCSGR